MASKAKRLVRCNEEFLRELAIYMNLSHRSYVGKNKKELINLLCKKLSVEDVDRVVKLYMLCLDPKEAAKAVRPNGIGKIVRMVQDHFDHGKALREVKIGRFRCDLILVDGHNIMAFEVKTARDTVFRAIKQTNYYCLWANEVYLAYDVKHRTMVRRMPLDGIGLVEVSKNDVSVICPAKENQINPLDLLCFLPYAYLRRVASNYGIKTSGKKVKIASRLNEVIRPNVVHEYFLDYLTPKPSIN